MVSTDNPPLMIDSHCHLQLLDYSKMGCDITKIVEEATNRGVTAILCVATNLQDAQEAIKIAEQFPHIYASVGVHPSEKLATEPEMEDYLALADHPKVIAIGETGLDYYYNDTGLDNMRERFRRHIHIAHHCNKPLIIHSRNAREATIRILREENAQKVRGVMHCFTESWEMAEQALALGFYISFSGIVTFKNAQAVADVAAQVPLDRLLIETDAPYLTPVPYRGKPNQPQYVYYVAEKIAQLKQQPLSIVAEQTTNNFLQLFSLATTTAH